MQANDLLKHDWETEFPILKRKIKDHRLVYLDNAATTLTPQSVTNKITEYYHAKNANVHRGVHTLSQEATDEYELSRERVSKFIGANLEEVVFTSGTTDSINLVATSYGAHFLKSGDEIIVTTMEHHSNLVPWHLLAKQKNLTIKAIEVDEQGCLNLDHYQSLLSPKTKLVACTWVSNTLGTINPIKKIIDLAHENGAVIVVDAAQSIAHIPCDVKSLDIDFMAFSGHKLFGPTGVGVLYGKQDLLNAMPPYRGGGSMITSVKVDSSSYLPAPHRFEAGTPMIAQVIGLGAAIEFVEKLSLEKIALAEKTLTEYAEEKLANLDYVKIIGNTKEKIPNFSLVIDNIHPHDVGTILDDVGVAVRTGHHCTEPLMKHFRVPATTRASFSIYNRLEDIDALIEGLVLARKTFL